jgi:hypothetical protein
VVSEEKARSNPMRSGLEAPEILRDATEPDSSTNTHSVLVPPPSNPRAKVINKGYDNIEARADG